MSGDRPGAGDSGGPSNPRAWEKVAGSTANRSGAAPCARLLRVAWGRCPTASLTAPLKLHSLTEDLELTRAHTICRCDRAIRHRRGQDGAQLNMALAGAVQPEQGTGGARASPVCMASRGMWAAMRERLDRPTCKDRHPVRPRGGHATGTIQPHGSGARLIYLVWRSCTSYRQTSKFEITY